MCGCERRSGSCRDVSDGASGPWADSVANFQQGSAINGGFLPGRSDPTQALGPAESPPGNDNPVPSPPTFVSLGFAGTLTLGFQNPICATAGMSLLDVLGQGGGGDKALGRHAVAALLNALSPSVDYPYTSAQVKQMGLRRACER